MAHLGVTSARSITAGWAPPFDVLMFDGPHTEQDQYDGIVYRSLLSRLPTS